MVKLRKGPHKFTFERRLAIQILASSAWENKIMAKVILLTNNPQLPKHLSTMLLPLGCVLKHDHLSPTVVAQTREDRKAALIIVDWHSRDQGVLDMLVSLKNGRPDSKARVVLLVDGIPQAERLRATGLVDATVRHPLDPLKFQKLVASVASLELPKRGAGQIFSTSKFLILGAICLVGAGLLFFLFLHESPNSNDDIHLKSSRLNRSDQRVVTERRRPPNTKKQRTKKMLRLKYPLKASHHPYGAHCSKKNVPKGFPCNPFTDPPKPTKKKTYRTTIP